ncbi:hypothetical protein T440DRAFT_180694 [Plenodomus tracheiphilus IPT5]|uniref:Uncharacterized protein n=1 Tax=Plenodomus tracheiphilus IPT5 TaxID=1408161 RepID=A0A6A7AXH0_9PLEO|nr:hypothetical protein T440DRAFT_180694 [Plenodomus tracheiphilus IPT5]
MDATVAAKGRGHITLCLRRAYIRYIGPDLLTTAICLTFTRPRTLTSCVIGSPVAITSIIVRLCLCHVDQRWRYVPVIGGYRVLHTAGGNTSRQINFRSGPITFLHANTRCDYSRLFDYLTRDLEASSMPREVPSSIHRFKHEVAFSPTFRMRPPLK